MLFDSTDAMTMHESAISKNGSMKWRAEECCTVTVVMKYPPQTSACGTPWSQCQQHSHSKLIPAVPACTLVVPALLLVWALVLAVVLVLAPILAWFWLVLGMVLAQNRTNLGPKSTKNQASTSAVRLVLLVPNIPNDAGTNVVLL